jgi:glyoxylate reductase
MFDDMSARVYVTRTLPPPGHRPLVEAGFDVDQHDSDRPPSPDDLVEHLAQADALLCMLTERIDGDVLDAAPRLRVVANLAVGFDNIDLAAASSRGVVVTNTPDVLTEATADLAWALLLAAARRLGEGERLVRSGQWQGWAPSQLLGLPVHGRTLGVLGLGKIGRAVARRAAGFGMEICYHNRRRDQSAEADTGARFVGLDELFETADFLSLHAPLNESSRHVVDGDALGRMKPTAVLVNTARGPLVDESALVDALRAGKIAAAGLDVFEREPALAEGLAALDNVVLAPHLGSATTEARAAMVRCCCDNIVAVLSGQPPPNAVDPEVVR